MSESTELKRYARKPAPPVVAVQLDLETPGFDYEKWGSTQACKSGDWVVSNGDETYTIDRETFAKTYREVSRGLYVKTVGVWAEQATEAGSIGTKEGMSAYKAGDYLVYNGIGRSDGYPLPAAKFKELYEPEG